MLLGAGGAGSAIADAVADAGAVSLAIFDVDKAKAGELASRIAKFHPGCQATAGEPTVDGIDILINATPIGMAESDPLPMKLGKLDPKFVVADVIVKPGPTPFLKQARGVRLPHCRRPGHDRRAGVRIAAVFRDRTLTFVAVATVIKLASKGR